MGHVVLGALYDSIDWLFDISKGARKILNNGTGLDFRQYGIQMLNLFIKINGYTH